MNRKSDLLPSETSSSLLFPMIYEYRSKTVNGKCNKYQASLYDVTKYASTTLMLQYPWLNTALFPLESKSLMYCAIPKVASKTLVSLMIYVYIRDIIGCFDDNLTNIDISKTQAEQLIDIPKLTMQLQKSGIPIPNINEPSSIASLIQTYLHILRFESLNETSPSLYYNPWRINLKDIFRRVDFKSVSNISNMFSSTFTRALFVRHPFERLASAYKERIAILPKDRIQPEPYYDNVRKMICLGYTNFYAAQRGSPRSDSCDSSIPPFEDFVRHVLRNTETPIGIARMDGHWQPYTVVCQVCKFKYNFIGKYETFDDDLTSLLKRLNVSTWNVQKRRGASGHTTSNYQELFSSLPDDLICRLKRLYKDDLDLFNYRTEDYVNRTTLIC